MVRDDRRVHRLAQVRPQVEPVRDLHRVWGAGPDALSVCAPAISTHNLNTRVLPEPCGQGRGLPVRQHVNRPVRRHVDQDRVVGVATTNREIVDTEDRDRRRVGHRLRADQPDQQVRSARHAQPDCQPRPRAAGQCQCDPHQRRRQRRGSTCEWRGQARDLLAEGLLLAALVPALEPPDASHDPNPPSGQRAVRQRSGVLRVHARRPSSARRTSCVLRDRTDEERHRRRVRLHSLDRSCPEVRKHRLNIL